MEVGQYLSSYVAVTFLLIGVYMRMVQGPNLININHLKREGQFSNIVGISYMIVGVISIILLIFY